MHLRPTVGMDAAILSAFGSESQECSYYTKAHHDREKMKGTIRSSPTEQPTS